MPIARFQMPDGKIGRFEVPEGTTPEQAQAQIEAFVSQQQAAPVGDIPTAADMQPNTLAAQPATTVQPSLMDRVVGAGEAGLTLLTGATGGTLGTIEGGLRGITQSMRDGTFGTQAGAEAAQQTALQSAESMTYSPRTQSGQEQVAALGNVLEPLTALAPVAATMPIGTAVQAARPAVGPMVRNAASRLPGAEAVAKALKPTPIVDVYGRPSAGLEKVLKANDMQFENVANDLAKELSKKPEEAVANVIKRKIERGDTDDFLASKKVDPATNAIVEDPIAKEALKQGFRPGDVQTVKQATPGTVNRMRKMLDIRRRTYANERAGLDQRPSDVLGDSLLERFSHIRKTADTARNELDYIAKKELAGTPINADKVSKQFFDELNKLDVEVDTSAGKPKFNFVGSMISKDPSSQRVIKNVADLLAEGGTPDALRAHKLKRQLDAMIDFQKKSNGGLTESGRNVAKSMRSVLNDSIREVSPDYARVNDTLSKSLQSMNEFENILGPSIDVWAPGANKAIGQDLRGLMSNRKSRVRLENAVTSIDKTAKELGGQFDDNLGDLALFAKTLDDQFGASARTSFAGDIESSARRVARGSSGIKEELIDRASKKMGDLRNINDKQAFKAMDDLLRTSGKTAAKSTEPSKELIIPE